MNPSGARGSRAETLGAAPDHPDERAAAAHSGSRPRPEADPALAGYLHAATRPLTRPFLGAGWGRRALYSATCAGLGLAVAMPSLITAVIGVAAATLVTAESGVLRRGTVWGDVLAGGRRETLASLALAPDLSSPGADPEISSSVQVATPSPVLGQPSAEHERATPAAAFGGTRNEEELRARFLAAVAEVRARGGGVREVATMRREAQSALVRLRAIHAVERLHRPVPEQDRSASAPARDPESSPPGGPRPNAPQAARRPRRRARTELDLDEEPHSGRGAPTARAPLNRPPPSGNGAEARCAVNSEGVPQPRAVPAHARGRRRTPGAPTHGDPDAPASPTAEAAAELAALRVFAFLPEGAAAER
jgi:hypothetical protein